MFVEKLKSNLAIIVSITVIIGFLAGAYGKAFAIDITATEANTKATATEIVVDEVRADTANQAKDIENLFDIATLQNKSINKLSQTITANNKETNEKITDLRIAVEGLSVKIENMEKNIK
jgi:hypothetical protein